MEKDVITNAEINIYKGDPTKGHDGWMYTILVGTERHPGVNDDGELLVVDSIITLSLAAGAHLKILVDKDNDAFQSA